MRYIHRFAMGATHAQIAELRDLGMKFDPDDEVFHEPEPIVAFKVAEDHPHWPLVRVRMSEWGSTTHFVYTEFTPRELDSARWLRLTAWDNGYPQPQEDQKFFEVTFDLTNCCPHCRLGKVQNASYRIKGEPKWGRRGIMTLGWVFEEFFVPPAVWETIFKPFGIPCRPVLNRRGKQLETVVQLVIDEEVDLVMDNLSVQEVCDACGRHKYRYSSRGYHPPLAKEPSGAIAKTRQAFGDGWGIRAAIVSQELRRAMVAHKIRGAQFTPVESHLDAFEA